MLGFCLMADEIISRTENKKVEVHHLDLASLASIRKFANNIIDTETKVDILINNAGATGLGNKRTADNLQIGMQVNHFGPFLLTCLLAGKSNSILAKRTPCDISWSPPGSFSGVGWVEPDNLPSKSYLIHLRLPF
jgi:hypothetical protein